MGTFHSGKGELHGITVVVETDGEELFVGRCDEVTPQGVVLLDADAHREGGETARATWLDRAARFGVWPTMKRVVVPATRVRSVRRLADHA
jgi:hypothetical protein